MIGVGVRENHGVQQIELRRERLSAKVGRGINDHVLRPAG